MNWKVALRPKQKGESLVFSAVHAPDKSHANEWGERQLKSMGEDPQNWVIQAHEVKDNSNERR